jgi:hypothetical protein
VRNTLASIVFLAFAISAAFGQALSPNRTARISGRFKDFHGVPVANATVRLVHSESDVTAAETKTGPDGKFRFLRVVPCFYDLYFVNAGVSLSGVFTLPGRESDVSDVLIPEPVVLVESAAWVPYRPSRSALCQPSLRISRSALARSGGR